MTSKAIHEAQQLHKRYAIEDPTEIPIEDLIQAQGAMYDERPMNGAEGRIIFGAKSASITVNSLIAHSEKRRFVRAHELGHLSLHRGLQPYFRCDDSAFQDWSRSGSHESEANTFASELLMPSDLFKHEADKQPFSTGYIADLSRLFQTSLTSTAIRYSRLGPEPIAIFWSQHGIIQWNCHSDGFIARYLRKQQTTVHSDSVAYQFFKNGLSGFSGIPQMVLPNVWFDDRRVPNDLLFFEDCIIMPRLEATLSFVWSSGEFKS
jgi:Zn-dependent peptidase ImmA (M78 family)